MNTNRANLSERESQTAHSSKSDAGDALPRVSGPNSVAATHALLSSGAGCGAAEAAHDGPGAAGRQSNSTGCRQDKRRWTREEVETLRHLRSVRGMSFREISAETGRAVGSIVSKCDAMRIRVSEDALHEIRCRAMSGVKHKARERRPDDKWNESKDARLKELWASEMSTIAIGVALRTTKNSVVGRAHRLGLLGRPSPIKHGGAAPVVKRERHVTLPPIVSIAAPNFTAVAALSPEPMPIRPACMTPRDDCGCQFPMWGDNEPVPRPPLFCGAARVRLDSAYCALHSILCYERV